MTWPLARRRGPGSYGAWYATVKIVVDTTEPPRLFMWAYVENGDGTREWVGGTHENEVTFEGRCRILFVMQSAEEPAYDPTSGR